MSAVPATLSCIIPCLNEQANLGVLLPQLLATLAGEDCAAEVIVVDDGSSDDTSELLAQEQARGDLRLKFHVRPATSAGRAPSPS